MKLKRNAKKICRYGLAASFFIAAVLYFVEAVWALPLVLIALGICKLVEAILHLFGEDPGQPEPAKD